MAQRWLVAWTWFVCVGGLTGTLSAQEAFRFPEGRFDQAELKYIHGLPVLRVTGTPEQIGQQLAKLAVQPSPNLPQLARRVLADVGAEKTWGLITLMGGRLMKNLPSDHLAELEAVIQTSGIERNTVVFASTIADLSNGLGCSTIVVDPQRSQTGHPLFARNFEWLPTQGLVEQTLILVCQPKGKHAYVSITFVPVFGVISGMNDAGLAVTINEINVSKDNGHKLSLAGTPLLTLLRRILEECETVEQAEALLKSATRTRAASLTVCDRRGGVVLEITTKTVQRRKPIEHICLCTNQFRCDELCVDAQCWRYAKLQPLQTMDRERKLGIEDLKARLDSVHQGKYTLHAMIFEPYELRLHLAYGPGPATKRPYRTLDLKTWLSR